MIVRILGEGQFDLPSSQLDRLNKLDNKIVEAVAAGKTKDYSKLLVQLLDVVKIKGKPLPLETLKESDLILPSADTTLQEARQLFKGEGLIPG